MKKSTDFDYDKFMKDLIEFYNNNDVIIVEKSWHFYKNVI